MTMQTPQYNFSTEDILNDIGDAVCIGDIDMNYIWVNKNFAAIYGLKPEQVIGKNAFDIYPNFKKSVFYENILKVQKTGQPNVQIGYSQNGKQFVVVRAAKYKENLFSLVIYQMKEENKSDFSNKFDSLTSLPNRSYYQNKIKNVLKYPNNLNMFLIDINNFKLFNEKYGSHAGDACLMEIAARIKQTVDINDFVARVAGDQFLIITFSPHYPDMLMPLKKSIRNYYLIDQKEYNLEFTISHYNVEEKIDPEMPLHYLETALKVAKNKKIRFNTFNHDMLKNVESYEMIQGIKNGIKNKEFLMYYQPQMDMISGKVCGVEALIRWIHPKKGFIPPSDFLQTAYEAGLMSDLDKYVVEKVIEDNLQLNLFDILPISVNLSSYSIVNKDSQEFIKSAVMMNNSLKMCFEITETGVIDSVDAKLFLEELKNLGAMIAIDDFGTGYCSLEYLLHYSCDFLKIDREFVKNIEQSSKNKKIVSNIIKLGQSLGAVVIAEGVETSAEEKILQDFNCDIIQGYLYGRPMKIEDFKTFCALKGISNLKSNLI